MEQVKDIKTLKVDVTKLYTQKAYADKIKVTRGRVNQLIKAKTKKFEIIKINGATLVYEGSD